ncbi:MAG: histidine kinase [Polaromonas sp.]|nr:histidine kinase [Polaromonas sp.]
MNPLKGRQASLSRRLVCGVLAALLLVWAGFVAVGWRTGVHEADELTDGHLAGTAALLLALDLPPFTAGAAPTARQASLVVAAPSLSSLKKHDYQFSLSVLVRDGAGHVLARSGEAPVPLFALGDGFADLQLGMPATAWRSFSQWDAAHGRQVTVLVKTEEREALAEDVAVQLAAPGLWLLPAVALALGAAVLRGLQPLKALSRDVQALDVDTAERLQARHPYREFNAVVRSINQLLGQQQAALERERQLASEIAHELRTPLSSIALQAASLRGALPPDAQAAALRQIGADALRAGHVISQLLALARTGRDGLAQPLQAVDLAALARQVVASYAQAAWQSGHLLGVQGPERLTLQAHPLLLELALRNLIDNALQHTASGTSVEIQWGCAGSRPWLQVCDDGAGAGGGAEAPASGVHPPSARSERLGLGHKIVGRVMHIHGGSFEQPAPAPPFSRCYRLCFAAFS